MKTQWFAFAVAGLTTLCQLHAADSFPLWPEGAPGALGKEDKDIPTLTVYTPAEGKANGVAVVICPGGGYGGLANHEGEHYARFLNEQGVAGFVLKYRLGPAGYKHPSMLQDASRAIRAVRARAAEWRVDPRRIGIMGSSAGGHLASTALTHFDPGKADASDAVERQSSRPDFGILCYAVITMGEYTHKGSKHNLLGENPSEDLVKGLSNELQVTRQTPPCFLWHTWEDKAVPVENTLQFAEALRKAEVPFDLHIYQKGGHGLGLGSGKWDPDNRHPWTADLIYWLKAQSVAANPH
jgi:acetyl esterase/lipase